MGILNCIFVIIGVIVGAGFASGKEIYSFFFVYGKKGFLGILISVCLIGYVIYKTLKIIKKYNIEKYDDLLDVAINNYKIKKINIKIILNFIVNIFLIVSFFIMCAGFCAYFSQEFKIPEFISSIFLSIFCFFVLNKNIKGIFTLNLILIPLITIILTFLGIKSFSNTFEIMDGISQNKFWLISAILYASYNTITLISILIPMKKYIKNNIDILKTVSIVIILMLVFFAIIISLLFTIKTDINKIELPVVYAAINFGTIYKYLYGIIIVVAIITTAISSAYGFLNNISTTKEKYKKNNAIICFFEIFIPILGFSNLINILYPIFGILGLIQLILIFKCK